MGVPGEPAVLRQGAGHAAPGGPGVPAAGKARGPPFDRLEVHETDPHDDPVDEVLVVLVASGQALVDRYAAVAVDGSSYPPHLLIGERQQRPEARAAAAEAKAGGIFVLELGPAPRIAGGPSRWPSDRFGTARLGCGSPAAAGTGGRLESRTPSWRCPQTPPCGTGGCGSVGNGTGRPLVSPRLAALAIGSTTLEDEAVPPCRSEP